MFANLYGYYSIRLSEFKFSVTACHILLYVFIKRIRIQLSTSKLTDALMDAFVCIISKITTNRYIDLSASALLTNV